jgi:hypothetical protein
LRGAEVEVGPSDAEAVDAVAVLALEAAELLDEVALGEARLGVAAHVLVEGGGVVLVGREGRAALRRELGEPAQDHDLVLVSHKCWNSGRRSPLGPTKNAKLGSAGKLMPSDSPLLAAEGSSTMVRSDRKIGGGLDSIRQREGFWLRLNQWEQFQMKKNQNILEVNRFETVWIFIPQQQYDKICFKWFWFTFFSFSQNSKYFNK